MSDHAAFLAQYQETLDTLKTMCESRLASGATAGPKTFSRHVSTEDTLAVLLDHDLLLIQTGRHPAGDYALLEVAHHAILLHQAKLAARQQRLNELVEREKAILDRLNAKAKEDIQAAEDKKVFADIDKAVKAHRKAAKAKTPKRKKR